MSVSAAPQNAHVRQLMTPDVRTRSVRSPSPPATQLSPESSAHGDQRRTTQKPATSATIPDSDPQPPPGGVFFGGDARTWEKKVENAELQIADEVHPDASGSKFLAGKCAEDDDEELNDEQLEHWRPCADEGRGISSAAGQKFSRAHGKDLEYKAMGYQLKQEFKRKWAQGSTKTSGPSSSSPSPTARRTHAGAPTYHSVASLGRRAQTKQPWSLLSGMCPLACACKAIG